MEAWKVNTKDIELRQLSSLFQFISSNGMQRRVRSSMHLILPRDLVSTFKELSNGEKSTLISSTVESHGAKMDRLEMWWRSSNQRLPLSVEPPYQLTITTMPTHFSALDTTAHQLYWKYQNKVHGDPDPFEDVEPNSTDNQVGEWGTRSPKRLG